MSEIINRNLPKPIAKITGCETIKDLVEKEEWYKSLIEVNVRLGQALKDALEDKRWTDDDMIDFVRFYKNGKVGKYVALEKFKQSKLKDDEQNS